MVTNDSRELFSLKSASSLPHVIREKAEKAAEERLQKIKELPEKVGEVHHTFIGEPKIPGPPRDPGKEEAGEY